MHSYQYDAEGRISSVDGGAASYSYDSANRRLKKVVGTTTTYYVWEGSLVIAEYSNGTGGTGGTGYYLADRLSTRMITDVNGAVKGTQDHLPFGEDSGTSTGQVEKHRFTSYERDNESGTDYAVNRQYSQVTGRFNQPDPIAGSIPYPQSLNRYSYVRNDATNSTDPMGLVENVWSLWAGFGLLATTNVTWDGATVPLYMLGMVAHLWMSGGADIIPFGATRNRRGDGWIIRTGEDESEDVSDLNDLWRTLTNGIQKIVPDPITSDKGVLKELYCLWVRGGYGYAATERALWITNTASGYASVPWPWSAESKQETWKGQQPAGTVALAHTHPDRSTQLSKAGPKPSTTGGNTGKGDQGTADILGLPNYVVTGQAIWKAVPHAKDPVQVAGSEWWKPFDKAKVKCK